ncbi:HNH endonuclease [Mycobacteroides abscessus]|uniref:HNH endonuclease n=1 Tax=Mycobacteroides abscessus TaxID=36809 RepID=UPI000C25D3EE|nr:HNH endonuclease [Mycobacteroides abscessus]
MTMMTLPAPSVKVFNADYSDHGSVSWQNAVGMLLRQVAYVLEDYSPPRIVRSPSVEFELPKSLMLTRYVYIAYRPDTCTRNGVLKRDRYTCGYCGGLADTWDHVQPQSRGGGNTWENTVAACSDCNGRKADRTPVEAGMRLLWEPYDPN